MRKDFAPRSYTFSPDHREAIRARLTVIRRNADPGTNWDVPCPACGKTLTHRPGGTGVAVRGGQIMPVHCENCGGKAELEI